MSEDPVLQGEGDPVALTTQWLSEDDPEPLLHAALERSGDLPGPPATLPA